MSIQRVTRTTQTRTVTTLTDHAPRRTVDPGLEVGVVMQVTRLFVSRGQAYVTLEGGGSRITAPLG